MKFLVEQKVGVVHCTWLREKEEGGGMLSYYPNTKVPSGVRNLVKRGGLLNERNATMYDVDVLIKGGK